MKGKGQYKAIPSTWRATLTRFFHCVGLIVQMSVLSSMFNQTYFLTDEFKHLSVPFKMYHMMGVFLLRLTTYVVGFCLMDCGPLASGIAFNGYNERGEAQFDRISNVRLEGLVNTS